MTANVGNTDRAIRIIAGVAIAAAGVYFQSWWGAIAAVPIATAFMRWCPAYAPFGISTCRVQTK
ncbi:MAG: DUF2892 domain-containing protein [Candidatus Kapaibacterium sp.]|nr:MAG: DUF2892 domain-containing protein [Candidatus Kapabacteria bacterium]